MTRYNHFSGQKYHSISFGKIGIGEKFRMNKHKNGRSTILQMIKTSELSYMEIKSKKESRVFHSNFNVYEFNNIPNQIPLQIGENRL